MADGKVVISTALDNKGFEKGVTEAKQVLGGLGKSVTGTLGGLAKVTAKMTAGIVAAFGAAAVAITKQSVDAYADYEQLVGGVATLFKDGADEVVSYAEDAFYRAGVSANKYMETVTSFSASLISALGGDTVQAAKVADMAMVDMADNANKMGTALESIQTAYMGFSKGQFQLLDNLKLGYGGTKTEMERLLKDAQAISGVKYDINNLADVYNAIHEIQRSLGIAGATAEEAEKTISGSAAMTKAAWENVLTAISGGGDLDKAINNLVFSISKLFGNLVPVVERALAGIGKLIEQVAPQLVQTVAMALIKAIPSLLNAVYQMVIGLAKGIRQGIVALFTGESREIDKQIKDDASDALGAVTEGYQEAEKATEDAEKAAKRYLAGFDEIQRIGGDDAKSSDTSVTTPSIGGVPAVDIVVGGHVDDQATEKVQKKMANWATDIAQAINEAVGALDFGLVGSTIADGLNAVLTWVNTFFEELDWTDLGAGVGAGLSGMFQTLDWEGVGKFLTNGISALLQGLHGFVTTFDFSGFGNGLATATMSAINNVDWVQGAKDLGDAAIGLVDALTEWINGVDWQQVGDTIVEALAVVDWSGLVSSLAEGIGAACAGLAELLWGIVDEAWADVVEWWEEAAYEDGEFTMEGLLQGIEDKLLDVGQWIYDHVFTPIMDAFCGAFDIHSPSGVMEEQGGFLIQGLLNGITSAWEDITGFFRDAWDGIKEVFGKVGDWFQETFSDAWEGIVDVFSYAGDIFTDIKDGVVSAFKTVVNKLIDGINSVVALPFNGINDALKFVRDINILGISPFSGIKTINVPKIPQLAQGAVLPANKPFLAMVGDQRHGTNVEAPLATIQEAVANVMADMMPAMMAGFEAVVAEQQAIHRTVKGIEIGDTVIGQAAERYNRQMSVIRGCV